MKTRLKTFSENQNKSILKNRNFLNSQNYVLGKKEKKKVILKLFIENIFKIKKYFPLPYKKGVFDNFYGGYGETNLTLKATFYVLFLIILGFFGFIFFSGVIIVKPEYLFISFFGWLLFIFIFLYINIFFVLFLPFLFLYLIFFLIFLSIKLYVFNGYKNFYIIKYKINTNLIKKFYNINSSKAENNFYKIQLKN